MGKLSPLGTMTPGVEIERRCRNPAFAIIGFPAPEPIVLRVRNPRVYVHCPMSTVQKGDTEAPSHVSPEARSL